MLSEPADSPVYLTNKFMVGEIRPWPTTKTPTGWAPCHGQLISITTYPDLFKVIGYTFGGSPGIKKYMLPFLAGSVPVGAGTGQGLSQRKLGAVGPIDPETQTARKGITNRIVTEENLPPHTHDTYESPFYPNHDAITVNVSRSAGTTSDPNGNYFAAAAKGEENYYPAGAVSPNQYLGGTRTVALNTPTVEPTGTETPTPITNLMPYCTFNYCICTTGVIPTAPSGETSET